MCFCPPWVKWRRREEKELEFALEGCSTNTVVGSLLRDFQNLFSTHKPRSGQFKWTQEDRTLPSAFLQPLAEGLQAPLWCSRFALLTTAAARRQAALPSHQVQFTWSCPTRIRAAQGALTLRKTCVSEGYFFTRWQFLLRGNIGAVPASVAVPTGWPRGRLEATDPSSHYLNTNPT